MDKEHKNKINIFTELLHNLIDLTRNKSNLLIIDVQIIKAWNFSNLKNWADNKPNSKKILEYINSLENNK